MSTLEPPAAQSGAAQSRPARANAARSGPAHSTTLRPQPIGIPVPRPSARSTEYWQAAKRGELTYQKCTNCGFVGLRPFIVCAKCLGRSSERLISSGQGALYSWTVVWRPPDPAFSVPYAPAVVEMDDGFFMISAVVGCEPEDLVAGMRLSVEFHDASDDIALAYFAPA
jgi:uncharacterized OB-fold protein